MDGTGLAFDIDLTVRLDARTIDVAFAAPAGLVALFGRSGAGKTSVLNMIAGLLRPDRGRVIVAGRTLFDDEGGVDLAPEHRRAGYVFQDGRLFPHMSVRRNLLYGARLVPAADRWMTLDEATAFLGIGGLLDRAPATLSGGEAQRVAIGRALLSGARFLLMDEPLASLDHARRDEIMAVIERIRDELALPILYVTHDRGEVERLASSVVTID